MIKAVDEKYYQVIKPASLAERLMIAARDRIFSDFMQRMNPTPDSRIVDVGISDVITDAANVLERKYPYPKQITACGLGEAGNFQQVFPDIRYLKLTPNAALPFETDSFDIATASAVLEHVGSIENQRFFLKELLRIANRVFVTVPNRYFPVEHHTAVPLLHYTDASFKMAAAVIGKSFWSDPANLIFMTRRKLRQLAFDLAADATIDYTGLKLGPFSSNLLLEMRKP